MERSTFTLYNASAGSGKTYALTKAYLSLLLADGAPTKFRQLLALTFTNKAVGEMKTRILDSLYRFSRVSPPYPPLFSELCGELSLPPKELRQRSQGLLKRILHNYSFFEIATIDKFNHKIVKTFARDLQLSQSFEVELDMDLLLEEAVARLLERVGSEKELTEVLLAFALEKIEEDKSWNIAGDLEAIGKLLFQENHATPMEALRSKSIGDFRKVQQQLVSQIQALEAKTVEMAAQALREMAAAGFVDSDFPRQTLPNHFKKIADRKFNPKDLYKNQLEQNLREGKLLKAADKRQAGPLADTLLQHFLTLKQQLYQRSYLKNCYTHLLPLTVLNEIAKEIKHIERDRDLIPIASLNAILAKEIKNQPVPFIYERMGEKYRHYFIDEFQDTSEVQWHNLIPLLGNALESEDEHHERGSLLLVGDVKQAIYRWRGGRAEQFLNLLEGKSQPFVVPPTVYTLDTNWRSCDEIVTFNNSLFATIAPLLQNEAYRNLFLQGSQQKTSDKPGGFVHLSFLEKTTENKAEAYCQAVLEAITQVTAHNYAYADLCILVRDNAQARLVADFLAQQQVPILSSEALLLARDPKVRFLVMLLKIMDDPADQEAACDLLLFLAEEENDKHRFISRSIHDLETFLSSRYGFPVASLRGQPVLDILEKAIIQFDLADDTPACLTFLMDEVLVAEKKHGAGIHPFLRYWERKKASLSIAAPGAINAVQIMTIHKAKGLEFPFVIFPFANALLDDKRKKKKAWVPATPEEAHLGLEQFLISSTSDMPEYNAAAANRYREEEEQTVLDAINVLYVALTRAEKGLYIISETGKAVHTLAEVTSYAALFQYYLQQQQRSEDNAAVYTRGQFPENAEATSQTPVAPPAVPYLTRGKGEANFSIAVKSVALWDDERREALALGNLTHSALAEIKTAEDIPGVLENLQRAGHLSPQDAPRLQERLHAVVHHPRLREYFSGRYEVWNEREILTVEGFSLRPDRMLHFEKQITLIEYKTGKPSPGHREQVAQYTQALEAMGFQVKDRIIVYINQEIHPVPL